MTNVVEFAFLFLVKYWLRSFLYIHRKSSINPSLPHRVVQFTSNTFEVKFNRDKGLLRGRGGAFLILISEDDGISSLVIK